MTAVVVNSAAELAEALRNATGGDVIQLAAGNYDSLIIKDLAYSSDVTITSLDPENPAVFTEPVLFVRAHGLVLDNIVFASSGIEGIQGTSPLLTLQSCENVTMTDLVFTGHIPTEEEGVDPHAADTTRSDIIAGYGCQTGLRIHDSDNVTLEGAEFRDLKIAIYLGESSGLLLTEMSIEEVREGIMFYEVQDMTISDSVFQNFKPWLGMDDATYDTTVHDHPDMIQYWGDNSTTGVHNITITGNTFIAEEGSSTQTIFGHLDGAPSAEVTATNFVITDNLIVNGHTHGIALADVDGIVISGNVLLPNSETTDSVRIPVIRLDDSTNAVVSNNTLIGDYGLGAMTEAALAASNFVLEENEFLSVDPASAHYWKLWVPPSAYALVQAAEAAGATAIQGSAANETLWAGSQGSFLEGQAGNDTLCGRGGTDILTGGSGADRFFYDMRGSGAQGDDLILDLDFAEGDEIYILTSRTGLFVDTVDPDNTLRVLGSGSSVMIDSMADLWELVASGVMRYEDDGLGGGILSMTDGSGYALHLAGIQSTELLYAAQFAAQGAVTGSSAADLLQAPANATGPGGTAGTQGLFLNGLGGDDILKGQAGSDIMTGGSGADLFCYDPGDSAAQGDDLILDLDFAEGDAIQVQGTVPGLFRDDFDPDNALDISADGSSVTIDSMADLWELVISGALQLATDSFGNAVLSLADGSSNSLTLAGVDPSDFAHLDAITALAAVVGTAAGDSLSSGSHGSFLAGLDGDDRLSGRGGADILLGGAGADRFYFDLRSGTDQPDDLILDLDFSEGDEIFILTQTAGLFTDGADTSNSLRILSGGQSAIIDSLADLAEIVASGAMALTTDGEGGAILQLTDGSGFGLHLLGVDATDLVYGDRIAALPAVTGTAAADSLWASTTGSYIDALGGDDILSGRSGADVLEGGEGADRFMFDLRLTGAQDDLVLDLSFEEGDEIYIVSTTAGLFTDSADPSNSLRVLGNGASVLITSLADFEEVLASGAMVYESDGMGGGYLGLADGSGYRLQIATLDAFDFL